MKKKITPPPNEEFSVEFGDINAAKFFEIPYMSKKNHQKNQEKKEK